MDKTAAAEACLNQFDLMFVVTLRHVDSNMSLEDILINQHQLQKKLIHSGEIKRILETSKVLIAFDGYDEYRKGSNSDIDAVISDTKGSFSLIVTSRPGGYLDKADKETFTEVQINDLRYGGIVQNAKLFFGELPKVSRFMTAVEEAQLLSVVGTPVMLFFMCVVFETNDGSLPKTQTEIIQEIVNMFVKRSTAEGKLTSKDNEEISKVLQILGQLSWKALQKDTGLLRFSKV